MVTRRGEGEGEGEIVGFGHWELHKAREGKGDAELEPEPEIPLPEGTDMEQAKALWAALERVAGKIEGDYYSASILLSPDLCRRDGFAQLLTLISSLTVLHQVAVDPSAQRCGAGKALVQWGVDLAAKGGLPYYLDSTPGESRRCSPIYRPAWALTSLTTLYSWQAALRSLGLRTVG